ncbi:MAG: transcriptional regulator NrdR [candidate division Zixibacteria bacterium]|nr:transcriptional regulator NrdR [candidate division Zixibacteria bacterium]MBU1470357.1 transcriptional regulator NrdR [candidate division Zixibacteria bacterium]MBU2624915.1 transcriptional regulator NrdR [candidate division Zixibacteria bacterium]
MKCPHCGGEEDKVVDSRSVQEGRAIRRRRECISCGERFTTYEYVEIEGLTVRKSDDRREPFDRQKLKTGLELATNKRPISQKQIENIVIDIEKELFNLAKQEVSSEVIGAMIMERLKEIDEVAYVRFASVYRKFKDTEEFYTEVRKLLDKEE